MCSRTMTDRSPNRAHRRAGRTRVALGPVLLVPLLSLMILFAMPMPHAAAASNGSFPDTGDFNGMSIDYDIAGTVLGTPVDSWSNDPTRIYSGNITLSQLCVSGIFRMTWASADIDASAEVWAGSEDQNQPYTWSPSATSTTWEQHFSVCINVPSDATSGGFSMHIVGHYGNGQVRSLTVSGTDLEVQVPGGGGGSGGGGGGMSPLVPIVAVVGAVAGIAGVVVVAGVMGKGPLSGLKGNKGTGQAPPAQQPPANQPPVQPPPVHRPPVQQPPVRGPSVSSGPEVIVSGSGVQLVNPVEHVTQMKKIVDEYQWKLRDLETKRKGASPAEIEAINNDITNLTKSYRDRMEPWQNALDADRATFFKNTVETGLWNQPKWNYPAVIVTRTHAAVGSGGDSKYAEDFIDKHGYGSCGDCAQWLSAKYKKRYGVDMGTINASGTVLDHGANIVNPTISSVDPTTAMGMIREGKIDQLPEEWQNTSVYDAWRKDVVPLKTWAKGWKTVEIAPGH